MDGQWADRVDIIGPHQSCADRYQPDDTDHKREVGYRDMARDMVSGVPRQQAYAEGGCYDTRGEDVNQVLGNGRMMHGM